MKCLKPSVFFNVHLRKAFWKYHFVLRGPIQNWDNGISCRRKDRFLITLGKKVWKLFLIKQVHVRTAWKHLFSTLPQACGKFFQDWTSDGSIMPPLEASRPFPTISVGSPHLSFWANAIGFHFSKIFHVESRNTQCLRPQQTYVTSYLRSRMFTTCASVATYLYSRKCQGTLIAPPHPTTPRL